MVRLRWMKAIPSTIKAESTGIWARGLTSFPNSCISLAFTWALDNSSSRSMYLLLPMISRHLNMSLLPFSDTVSDLILAIAVFPTVEKVLRVFFKYDLKSCLFHLSSRLNKGLGTILSYAVWCDKVVPGIFWCNTTWWDTIPYIPMDLPWPEWLQLDFKLVLSVPCLDLFMSFPLNLYHPWIYTPS